MLLLLSYIVPSGSPNNLTATTISSTALLIEWQAPDIEEQNGVLIGYNIVYGSSLESTNVTTLNTEIILDDLDIFTQYSINVSARTVVGAGPVEETTAQTLGDSKSVMDFETICVYW